MQVGLRVSPGRASGRVPADPAHDVTRPDPKATHATNTTMPLAAFACVKAADVLSSRPAAPLCFIGEGILARREGRRAQKQVVLCSAATPGGESRDDWPRHDARSAEWPLPGSCRAWRLSLARSTPRVGARIGQRPGGTNSTHSTHLRAPPPPHAPPLTHSPSHRPLFFLAVLSRSPSLLKSISFPPIHPLPPSILHIIYPPTVPVLLPSHQSSPTPFEIQQIHSIRSSYQRARKLSLDQL